MDNRASSFVEDIFEQAIQHAVTCKKDEIDCKTCNRIFLTATALKETLAGRDILKQFQNGP